MDRHDQELLARQMRAIYPPPRHGGLTIVAILTIFLGGMIAGNFMSASTGTTQTAADEAAAFDPGGAPAAGR
jgi:hypothetical protein